MSTEKDETDCIKVGRPCINHSGVDRRLDSYDTSIKELWMAINQIRNWVIAGMSTVILSGGAFLINMIIKLLKA